MPQKEPTAKPFLRRSEISQKKYLAALKMLAVVRAKLPQGLAPLNAIHLREADRQPA